jgi:hypothetical protein
MGSFIQDIKVICDKDNAGDTRFVFRVMVEDKDDLVKTVNRGLLQKIEEGELDTQNLREVRIESNDKQGFFSSFVGDVKGLISQV